VAEKVVTERKPGREVRDGGPVGGREVNGNAHVTEVRDVAVYDHLEPRRIDTVRDRIRWGPILAGLVTALSTLVVLSVLGLAVGLTAYEPGDRLQDFGIGAGIWGAVSTILAFLLGGWLAAYTSVVRGRGNGLLNGAMVWAVSIPLILYLLGAGVGTMLNVGTGVATAAAPVIAEQATPAGADATAATAQAEAQQQVTPQTVAAATDDASQAAWGTLIALLLGLIAAAAGGLLGARTEPEPVQRVA
jgi:hypothetical protein